ncbi:MAG: hypothetical protein ACKVYV_01525 [Limisphaerales bacterium]
MPPELAARVAAGAKVRPAPVPRPLPKAADAVGPEPGAPAGAEAQVVPWAGDTLKPLFEQVIPALEKSDVASLVKRASAIDEAIGKEVARDAWWNPAAKAGVIASGPACAAEILNSLGVGQEKAHWVAFLVASGSIYAGRQLLVAKLAELEGKLAKAKKVEAKEGA